MRPLAITAACLVISVARSQSFAKAQIIFLRSSDGVSYNPPRQHTLSSPAEIAKLVHFLPGVGLSRGGLKPSGWSGWGTIRLIRAKGPGIAVFFSSDAKVYSMIGKQGDFPAAKGFRDYLLDLERHAKP